MHPDPNSLETRITRIENQLRRARLLAGGSTGVAIVLLLSGYGSRADEVLQTERLELVGARGDRHAVLSADPVGFAVTLLGPGGQPAAILRLTTEPRLTVETGRGEEVAGLGGPKVRHLTE